MQALNAQNGRRLFAEVDEYCVNLLEKGLITIVRRHPSPGQVAARGLSQLSAGGGQSGGDWVRLVDPGVLHCWSLPLSLPLPPPECMLLFAFC